MEHPHTNTLLKRDGKREMHEEENCDKESKITRKGEKGRERQMGTSKLEMTSSYGAKAPHLHIHMATKPPRLGCGKLRMHAKKRREMTATLRRSTVAATERRTRLGLLRLRRTS